MELPHVRYLYVVNEVYRTGRLADAADAANMSRPAATQALARVEEKLGVVLFERRPKGMVPTPVGAIFQLRLNRILGNLRRGDSLARRKSARRDDGKPRTSFHRFCSPVQLRTLAAIARTGSFNQAARELGVSQPGVHRAVSELAKLSGLTLFDQTRGGVVLNSAAEVFVRHVRLAANEFQQAAYEINEFLGKDITGINVGSMPLSRASILPAAIDQMMRDSEAGVQVNCVDARYHTLLRNLRFGDLDVLIGALRFPKPDSDVEQELLFMDDLAVVTSPTHPLANTPDVTIEDTLSYPWIAPPQNTPTGAYLFEKLRIHELHQSPVRAVSSSLVLLRGLIARGEYVSIASKRQIEVEESLNQLVRLPIELPGSERPIGLTFRSGWMPTPAQKRFLDIIRENSAAHVNNTLTG